MDKSGGTVVELRARGAAGRRLADMGVTPGAEVKLVGRAPLGDPVRLFLRGYALSIRREDARNVLVRVDK